MRWKRSTRESEGAWVKRFSDLPWPARVYIGAIIVLGAAATVHTAIRWDDWSVTAYEGQQTLATLVFLALALAAGGLKVELADRSGRLNLGLPVLYLALLLRGTPTAMLCAVVEGAASSLLRRTQGGKPSVRPQVAHRLLF